MSDIIMMDNEKKADNEISNKKINIDEIDNEVDNNKKLLDSLDDIEENFNSLRRNIESCIDLLNISIKGDNIQRQLNRISEDNIDNYNNSMKNIYEKIKEDNNKLKELYNEKDKMNDDLKDIYKEEIRKEGEDNYVS